MKFTLSVRSFHVPATPGPRLTAQFSFRTVSRSTRETSEQKR